MYEAAIALLIIGGVAILCEAAHRCVSRKPRTITPAESDAVFVDFTQHDPGPQWSLWFQWATGGGWHLDCQGTREEVETQERQLRLADPEWRREFLVCEPGTSPALTRKVE